MSAQARPVPRTNVISTLADLVIQQASDHGFAVEVDAIRDCVDQFAKFKGLDATDDERIQACLVVEERCGLAPAAQLELQIGDRIRTTLRQPCPQIVSVRLCTDQSVAVARQLLSNPSSGWSKVV